MQPRFGNEVLQLEVYSTGCYVVGLAAFVEVCLYGYIASTLVQQHVGMVLRSLCPDFRIEVDACRNFNRIAYALGQQAFNKANVAQTAA